MGEYILALDQGTTSSRAILFDRDGAVCSVAQREFTQHFPRPGWVEHDAIEIWESQWGTAKQALQQCGVDATRVHAIGIANQRETTVVWERRTGIPVAPAIVWQDRRTADLCQQLRDRGLEPEIRRRTGLLLDPYFSGTKLAWILEHVPGVRSRAETGELLFGTIDSWLAWRLTGRHVTDPSNASRTLLYNIHSMDWDPYLLEVLGIPREMLPNLVPSSGFVGETRAELFGHAIPVCALAGDQQAATFGEVCVQPGMAKNTYGTGCFMLLHTGSTPVLSRNRLLSSVAWSRPGFRPDYVLEGSVFTGGAIVQWLRDGLGIIQSSSEVEALSLSVPDTGGVHLVPALTGLGAPWWDPDARGLITGITRGTTRAHIVRAAVEGIAFQCADLLDAMRSDAALQIKEMRVDGGAARNDFLMQFQADLLGIPVVRPKIVETTALGAAFLAGLGSGFWTGVDEITAIWRIDRTFEPALPDSERAQKLAAWRRAVERAREPPHCE